MSSDALAEDQKKSGDLAVFELLIFFVATIAAMLYEFGGALRCYFTSDDLVLVNYVYRVFNGDPGLLARMFTTVWMPDSTQETFYRPLVEASYALDFLISQSNPIGYHVSNLLFSFMAALAVACIAKNLAGRFDYAHPKIIGCIAGFLFAVCPLHTEVTCWIVGRVDGMSTMFYLISLALFLQLKPGENAVKSFVGWASLIAFWLGLLSKEMAFTLPFAVFLCSFFLSESEEFHKRCSEAFLYALPYFAALAIFLPLRFLAIGTFIGGYVGALGESMNRPFVDSVMRLTHLVKAAYPYNEALVTGESPLAMSFHAFYVLLGLYLICRLVLERFLRQQFKLAAFLTLWLILQYLPLLQVFRLSENLAGSRLFYLSTAIFSMLLAIILVPGQPKQLKSDRLIKIAAGALSGLLAALFIITGKINTDLFTIAATQVKELQTQVKKAVADLPPGKKLLIAYLPMQVAGAFVCNRYYVLQSLLSPPLLDQDIANRVALLEPRSYICDMAIPSGELRKKLSDRQRYETFFWNSDNFKLTKLNFDTAEDDTLPELKLSPGDIENQTKITAERPFKSASVRFAEVDLENSTPAPVPGTIRRMYFRFEDKPEPPNTMDFWCSAPYDTGLRKQTLVFPVDEVFSWYLHANRQKFSMYLGTKGNFKLTGARLIGGKDVSPSISVAGKNWREGDDGIFRPTKFPVEIKYDASNVPGSTQCLCELSRPRMMFQLENYTYRSPGLSKKPLKTWSRPGATGSILIEKNLFPENACYQLRVFAQKANGEIAGRSSDIVYIGVFDLPTGAPKGQEL